MAFFRMRARRSGILATGLIVGLAACQNPLLPDDAFETPAPAPIPGQQQSAQVGGFASGLPFATALERLGPPSGTAVGQKVQELASQLSALQGQTADLRATVTELSARTQQDAAGYYDLVGAISARLQTGSTPGNPILVEQRNQAEVRLDQLSQDIGLMNALATQLASAASAAAFLLDNVRATYGLSGALEEDHAQLSILEDEVGSTVVQIERLLNEVSDDISRQGNYLAAERRNLQTLTLAINNGELYGQSLANRAFSQFTPMTPPRLGQDNLLPEMRPFSPTVGALDTGRFTAPPPGGLPNTPLVVIRFDRPNVDYEGAVYDAISRALDRYPQARFELVAVSPTAGNAAQVALASSDAKRNAEDVLRTLTQQGLPFERVRMSAAASAEAQSSEVHIYVR